MNRPQAVVTSEAAQSHTAQSHTAGQSRSEEGPSQPGPSHATPTVSAHRCLLEMGRHCGGPLGSPPVLQTPVL